MSVQGFTPIEVWTATMNGEMACSLLATRARRVVLEALIEGGGQSTMEELHRLLDSHNKPIVDSMEEAQVELFHRHLPKLADHGIIEHNDRTGVVVLTEAGEDLEPLLNAVRKFDRMNQETKSCNGVG